MFSVLSEISHSLFQLIVISVSSVWAEILKMPFLSAGKTDFVRFGVIPKAAVSLVGLLKISEFFLGGGGHSKADSFYLFVYLLPFSFCLQLLPYEL